MLDECLKKFDHHVHEKSTDVETETVRLWTHHTCRKRKSEEVNRAGRNTANRIKKSNRGVLRRKTCPKWRRAALWAGNIHALISDGGIQCQGSETTVWLLLMNEYAECPSLTPGLLRTIAHLPP